MKPFNQQTPGVPFRDQDGRWYVRLGMQRIGGKISRQSLEGWLDREYPDWRAQAAAKPTRAQNRRRAS